MVLIDITDATVEKQVRLGRKPENVDNPAQAISIRVTFNNFTEVYDIMKNLNRLANAEDSMKQLRIHPDRSFKDRDAIQKLIQRAKAMTESEDGTYENLVRTTKSSGSNQRRALQTKAENSTDVLFR